MASILEHRDLADAPFGAEVRLDLSVPLTEQDRATLRELYHRHYLLVFPGTEMTYEQQLDLASCLGPIMDVAEKRYVSNTREDGILGTREIQWHSDTLFTDDPYWGIGLYAEEVTPARTSTKYASARRAYELLPEELRAEVGQAKALSTHRADYAGAGYRADLDPSAPSAIHPVLKDHPETGAPIVFVDLLHVARIEDVTQAQSERMLEAVFAILYGDDNVYEHWWQPHDFVIWDNRAVHHARGDTEVDSVGDRTLRRVVLGERSVEQQVPGHRSKFNVDGMK